MFARGLVSALFVLPLLSYAAVDSTIKNDVVNKDIKTSTITFTGKVSEVKIVEFSKIFKFIQNSYPNLKAITVKINSGGGDMDSGYMAYRLMKNSPVPVTTVNMSMIASAASLMYCAGSTRIADPQSFFVLHPVRASPDVLSDPIKPDDIDKFRGVLSKYTETFNSVYKACTDFNDNEREKILYSESTRMLLNASDALQHKLVTEINPSTASSDADFYIYDEP
ncbi:ATP-dependent Clp protease proteolytic subunit [Enterobacteriaceae bacterium C34A]